MSGGKDGLEIEEDLSFQRREWRIQTIAWFGLVALLVAALAGLVGPGPLSSTSRRASALEVRYLRFTRWQAPETLVVTIRRATPGPLQLTINRSYLDGVQVQQITPQPSGVKASGTNSVFTFDAQSTGAASDITFDLQPTSMGTIHGTFALSAPGGNASSVHLTQLIYP